MSYPSVDKLQATLANTVFSHTKDRKKAAGRALGTLVEIITYYTLRAWGFRDSTAIERRLEEYNNPIVTHNVEYSLHPILAEAEVKSTTSKLPISISRLTPLIPDNLSRHGDIYGKLVQLYSSKHTLRNSCLLSVNPDGTALVANLDSWREDEIRVTVSRLHPQPYAIFECKRVGVEEGMKKGPQTIEKAKQGAYVARSVSALQKIRLADGTLGGLIHRPAGTVRIDTHPKLLAEIVASDDPDLLKQFALTVGVVSNHGNWFTSTNRNKELEVLADSYDWLLFLTDRGLSDFISELLLEPEPLLEPARDAFLRSYTADKRKNCFTKVQMDSHADRVLQGYFMKHHERIQEWFNVISPRKGTLEGLHEQLSSLRSKPWNKIHQP